MTERQPTVYELQRAEALAYVRGNFAPALPDAYADWIIDLRSMAHSGTDPHTVISIPEAIMETKLLPRGRNLNEDGGATITLLQALIALHIEHVLDQDEPVNTSMERLTELLERLARGEATEEERAEAITFSETVRQLEQVAEGAEHGEPSQGTHPAGLHLADMLRRRNIHGRLQVLQDSFITIAMDAANARNLARCLETPATHPTQAGTG